MEFRDMGWLPAGADEDETVEQSEQLRLGETPGTFASQAGSLTGIIRFHRGVESEFLSRDRDVIVYLPPDYESNDTRTYPVLYLQDGQNLFDGATSYVPGHDWKADETAEDLISRGEVEPVIMVGVYHTNETRIDEYTPAKDLRHPHAGKARLYGRFLTEELKPFIDAVYRTKNDRLNTAIGGSSLGGLVSIFTALNYSDVYGKMAILSPSVWWGRRAIVSRVQSLGRKTGQRIWLDCGTDEGEQALCNVRLLRDALTSRGWVEADDLRYLEVEGGQHSEDAWAARFGEVLRWLFPGRQ